jgi:hypothetical protein
MKRSKRMILPFLCCSGCLHNLASMAGLTAHNETAARTGERSYRAGHDRGVVLAHEASVLGYNPIFLVMTRVRQ